MCEVKIDHITDPGRPRRGEVTCGTIGDGMAADSFLFKERRIFSGVSRHLMAQFGNRTFGELHSKENFFRQIRRGIPPGCHLIQVSVCAGRVLGKLLRREELPIVFARIESVIRYHQAAGR